MERRHADERNERSLMTVLTQARADIEEEVREQQAEAVEALRREYAALIAENAVLKIRLRGRDARAASKPKKKRAARKARR